MSEVLASRILVLGVGNPLVGDDGVGPRVIEALRDGWSFPERIALVDAGTLGFGLLDLIREADALVLVDSVSGSGEPPGTVLRFAPDEIANVQLPHSMHDQSLATVLAAAGLLGVQPDAIAIGVEIETAKQGVLALSAACEAAVPRAADAVLGELARLGVSPQTR